MSSWLKAGLIGGAVLGVLNLLGFIPCVELLACILGLAVFIGTGALAAHYMMPVSDAGAAAGKGALAALVAQALGGLIAIIRDVIQAAVISPGEIVSQLPPETFQQLEDAGMDPEMFEQFMDMSTSVGGAALCGGICWIFWLLIAAALGALGGAVYAAMQSDR